jgi:hypothetical protein
MKNCKLYILAFSILFVGCSDDFLDRQPLDQVVSTNFYKTETDAMEAVVAIYDALGYQSSPGISWSPVITVSDILSDDAYAGGGDANDGFDEDELNKFLIPTTNALVHSIWLKNYTGIYRANLLLERIGDIDASDEFKARLIAESKFLRAHFYFELVRFFENIPLVTETAKGPSDYSQEQSAPRNVYNLIAQDLLDAIEDLPEEIAANDRGRVSKWAAQGMLARIYLFYNGVYGSELDAAGVTVDRNFVLAGLEDLITNSGHALLEDYGEIFRIPSEFGPESVFEISHGDSPAWWDWGYLRGSEGNLAAQMQGPRVTGSTNWNRGWSFAPVTQKLVSDMSGDPRFEHTILQQADLDGNLVKGYQHTGNFSRKYSSDVEHWGSDGQFEHNRTCNQRVIRYSDILLMAAELGSPNAQSYLNMVRARVGLPSVPASLDNIFNERRFEFALEGHRYFDLLRRGLSIAENEINDQNERGPNYEGDQQLFEVTFNSTTRGFFPIPQIEVDLSAGLFIQNDGY